MFSDQCNNILSCTNTDCFQTLKDHSQTAGSNDRQTQGTSDKPLPEVTNDSNDIAQTGDTEDDQPSATDMARASAIARYEKTAAGMRHAW